MKWGEPTGAHVVVRGPSGKVEDPAEPKPSHLYLDSILRDRKGIAAGIAALLLK
jgi:hypothetical protein